MNTTRHSLDDTIAAIATPPGEGALGIVRLSGPEALAIADRLFRAASGVQPSAAATHTVHYGHIVEGDTIVDEVLLTVLRAPRTYTRQAMVEITGHGGMLPLRRILELALQAGARLAEPGEFTKRAFLNGRLDLAQGEAVLDIIRARTDASLRAALAQLDGGLSAPLLALHEELANLLAHVEAIIDFPEDDVDWLSAARCGERLQWIRQGLDRLLATSRQGRLLRDGAHVVICGRPNVGKSSLLNALLRANRAIVTPVPGTTRDTIEEAVHLQGLLVHLTDTAGLAATIDPIEREGIARSRAAIQRADLLLVVFDGSAAWQPEDQALVAELRALRADAPALLALNKRDCPAQLTREDAAAQWPGASVAEVSALTGQGLAALERALVAQLCGGAVEISDGALVTSARHQQLLQQARAAVDTALAGIAQRTTVECVASDVREAAQRLGEILGLDVTEDVLDRIFRQFCIGK